MDMLGKVLHKLRVWTGLADASESHLTPSHGWLLPALAAVRQQRQHSDAQRAVRSEGNARA
jgi:hypothetical protein